MKSNDIESIFIINPERLGCLDKKYYLVLSQKGLMKKIDSNYQDEEGSVSITKNIGNADYTDFTIVGSYAVERLPKIIEAVNQKNRKHIPNFFANAQNATKTEIVAQLDWTGIMNSYLKGFYKLFTKEAIKRIDAQKERERFSGNRVKTLVDLVSSLNI